MRRVGVPNWSRLLTSSGSGPGQQKSWPATVWPSHPPPGESRGGLGAETLLPHLCALPPGKDILHTPAAGRLTQAQDTKASLETEPC